MRAGRSFAAFRANRIVKIPFRYALRRVAYFEGIPWALMQCLQELFRVSEYCYLCV
jgi:hypothetical protein